MKCGGTAFDVSRKAQELGVVWQKGGGPRCKVRVSGITSRRFPPPWIVEEHNNACFIVKNATGQALSYFYFEDEPGRRSAAKLLTRDEPQRIAANIAKLPEPLRKLSV